MARSAGVGKGIRRGGGLLASGLVCLSLVALLVVPLETQRSTRELRDEIRDAADPARTLVTEVQYRLARQMSALRGLLITGDLEYFRRYEEAWEQEAAIYPRLEPLARRLGDDPLIRFVELRGASQQWHEALREEIGSEGVIRDAGEVPFEQERYLEALSAASAFDSAVVEATLQRREVIEARESRTLVVQVALALVALLAAVLAAWLGLRVERLAAAAEARRRQAEQALASTARAVEAKARLIRGVTHDVKNPLGAADGYADLMELGLKGELSPQQAAVVAKIRASIRGALSMLEDLLELSRAESGDLPVQLEPTSLSLVAREVVEEYQGSADAAGHRLELRLPAAPVLARTDAHRVRQVLGNLLSNALKYTPPPGQVTVEVLTGGGSPPSWAAVRVSDTGPGIPAEDRERVFEEFARLSSGGPAGHGLGLAISRRIAQLLGGELRLESEPGEGSTFELRLPALGDEENPRAVGERGVVRSVRGPEADSGPDHEGR